MTEPMLCIFPHSEAEFPNGEGELRNRLYELQEPDAEPYFLKKIRRADNDFKSRVTKGSLVLFCIKGQIIGEAMVQRAIEELSTPINSYYYNILFVPDSVQVYGNKHLTMLEILNWAGRKKLFPGTYAILGTKRDFESAFPKR